MDLYRGSLPFICSLEMDGRRERGMKACTGCRVRGKICSCRAIGKEYSDKNEEDKMFRKRFIALVMALTMLFTLMAPAFTFAVGEGDPDPDQTTAGDVVEGNNEQPPADDGQGGNDQLPDNDGESDGDGDGETREQPSPGFRPCPLSARKPSNSAAGPPTASQIPFSCRTSTLSIPYPCIFHKVYCFFAKKGVYFPQKVSLGKPRRERGNGMTLNQLLVGKSAVIRTVGGEGALRQHFLDIPRWLTPFSRASRASR